MVTTLLWVAGGARLPREVLGVRLARVLSEVVDSLFVEVPSGRVVGSDDLGQYATGVVAGWQLVETMDPMNARGPISNATRCDANGNGMCQVGGEVAGFLNSRGCDRRR